MTEDNLKHETVADANTMLVDVICPICKGDGYTAEHDPTSMDYETGEHTCYGCPIQVGCENCQGTGRVKGK